MKDSLEGYAQSMVQSGCSIGEASNAYLSALKWLRTEMLIGDVERGPCTCGVMTSNRQDGHYCCDECAEVADV